MRATLPGTVVVAVLALAGAPAAAQVPPAPAPPPEPTITPGISAAGVDVGGLTVTQATAKLQRAARTRLARPVVVVVAGRRFRLTMGRLRYRLEARRTARRAYRAGLRSSGQPLNVNPFIRYRAGSLRAFAAEVGWRSYRRPRNAWVRITLRRMVAHRSYSGRRLAQWKLRAKLRRVLRSAAARRVVHARRGKVRAPVRFSQLRRIYSTVVTVDRGGHRLRLFKRLRYDRSYPIAVGAAGFETPGGLHRIREKQVNPAWHAPNRPWAGSYAGRTVPGGAPDNPLKARWLGIAGGVGIHGTSESWSIGSNASHGCIRMHVSDVIDLYGRVPVGARVLIR